MSKVTPVVETFATGIQSQFSEHYREGDIFIKYVWYFVQYTLLEDNDGQDSGSVSNSGVSAKSKWWWPGDKNFVTFLIREDCSSSCFVLFEVAPDDWKQTGGQSTTSVALYLASFFSVVLYIEMC